jgi:hypothetical protein
VQRDDVQDLKTGNLTERGMKRASHRRIESMWPISSPVDSLRRVQHLAADLTGAVQQAGVSAPPPLVSIVEYIARAGEDLVAASTTWIVPVRSIIEQQREFSEAMATWAEQQRALAEQLATWAERNRRLSDEIAAYIEPVLATVERARDAARGVAPPPGSDPEPRRAPRGRTSGPAR